MEQKNSTKKQRRLCKFTRDEDKQLLKLVEQYSTDNWYEISEHMPNRNVRQCRERWQHYLSCTAPKKPWTPEEDKLLLQKVKEMGTKWRKIFPLFVNRTDISCKLRYLKLTTDRNLMLQNGIEFNHSTERLVLSSPNVFQTESAQVNQLSNLSSTIVDKTKKTDPMVEQKSLSSMTEQKTNASAETLFSEDSYLNFCDLDEIFQFSLQDFLWEA